MRPFFPFPFFTFPFFPSPFFPFPFFDPCYPFRCESVSDHSYLPTIMTNLCTEATLDRLRVARIDVAEAVTGDIIPAAISGSSGVSKQAKYELEKEAFDDMADTLEHGGNADVTDDLRKLWEEYEEQATGEARFVKDCDRLEMILQAYVYECNNEGLDLTDFFESTKGKARFDQTRAWDEEIRRRRAALNVNRNKN